MLPQAVVRHFQLPNLFVGNAHFDRSQDYRRQLISEIISALKSGLAETKADPQLERESGTDFSDNRNNASLSRLRAAVSPTHLQSRVITIEMLTTRQRPYGNQSPELALLGELLRFESEAKSYFGEKM